MSDKPSHPQSCLVHTSKNNNKGFVRFDTDDVHNSSSLEMKSSTPVSNPPTAQSEDCREILDLDKITIKSRQSLKLRSLSRENIKSVPELNIKQPVPELTSTEESDTADKDVKKFFDFDETDF